MNKVFHLYVDRVNSLIVRWDDIYERESLKCGSLEDLQVLQDMCLLGLISEMSDEVTQALINEVNGRVTAKDKSDR